MHGCRALGNKKDSHSGSDDPDEQTDEPAPCWDFPILVRLAPRAPFACGSNLEAAYGCDDEQECVKIAVHRVHGIKSPQEH